MSKSCRDTSRDGFRNKVETKLTTSFRPLWSFIMAIGPLRRRVNKFLINQICRRAPIRPHRLSAYAIRGESANKMAGYTSWESLQDREWFSRHLAPVELTRLPDDAQLHNLFSVKEEGPHISDYSTVLFMSFAHWFTDGFLMTDAKDKRKTRTTHHIDLNALYGLTRKAMDAVRLRSEKSGEKGCLKSECDDNGEVYAPAYFNENGEVKPEFKDTLPYPVGLEEFLSRLSEQDKARIKKTIFAFAGERANTTPYTSMLNNLFLREHNRIAGLLESGHPDWDDERVFQTARNTNIALLIKVVIEEYINHVAPCHFRFTADPCVCWHAKWNKPNWIPIEFNLLYRWHSLTPDRFDIDGKEVASQDILYNNAHLTRLGIGKLMESASAQKSWEMGLQNTPSFLVAVELLSVKQGRDNKLGTYNEYRKLYGFPTVQKFEQITGDPYRLQALKSAYGNVDEIEFFVGLMAEDVPPGCVAPPLLACMIGVDAFTQALTNPLLSEHVFNDKTFGVEGIKIIEDTRRLQDILNRNTQNGRGRHRVTMTYGVYN